MKSDARKFTFTGIYFLCINCFLGGISLTALVTSPVSILHRLILLSTLIITIYSGTMSLHMIRKNERFIKLSNYFEKQLEDARAANQYGDNIRRDCCLEQADATLQKLRELLL